MQLLFYATSIQTYKYNCSKWSLCHIFYSNWCNLALKTNFFLKYYHKSLNYSIYFIHIRLFNISIYTFRFIKFIFSDYVFLYFQMTSRVPATGLLLYMRREYKEAKYFPWKRRWGFVKLTRSTSGYQLRTRTNSEALAIPVSTVRKRWNGGCQAKRFPKFSNSRLWLELIYLSKSWSFFSW